MYLGLYGYFEGTCDQAFFMTKKEEWHPITVNFEGDLDSPIKCNNITS